MTKNVLLLLLLGIIFIFILPEIKGKILPDETPCEAGDIIQTIRKSFRKVIPEYYSNLVAIQINTGKLFLIKKSSYMTSTFSIH